MTRHYMPDSASRSARTEGLRDRGYRSPDDEFDSGAYADYGYSSRYAAYPEYDSYADYGDDDGYLDDHYGDDYGDYDFAAAPLDRRWLWVAAAAGAILLVAVVCTMVILGGGDSGSVASPASSPATTSATAPPQDTSAPAPPVRSLPPETITTVTPSPSATAPTTPAAPAPAETTPSPAPAEPAPPAAQTITYQVDGNRQFVDLVTVIYSDHQGALQTEVNVALPWTKTVVLDPGVALSSVTATSMAGQLNCSITDGAGATLAQQSANTMIASCTR